MIAMAGSPRGVSISTTVTSPRAEPRLHPPEGWITWDTSLPRSMSQAVSPEAFALTAGKPREHDPARGVRNSLYGTAMGYHTTDRRRCQGSPHRIPRGTHVRSAAMPAALRGESLRRHELHRVGDDVAVAAVV